MRSLGNKDLKSSHLFLGILARCRVRAGHTVRKDLRKWLSLVDHWTLCKQEGIVKARFKLAGRVFKAFPNTQSPSAKTGIFVCLFQVFNEFCQTTRYPVS